MLVSRKLPQVGLFASSVALTVFLLGACSDDKEDEGADSDSSAGTGGESGLVVPGDGDGDGDGDLNVGDGDDGFNGGRTELSDDQVDDIAGDGCTGGKYEGEVLPSVIQLVIDVSSSMRQAAPGTNLSKWEVTRDLLMEGIAGVEGNGLPASVGVGLLFYPNRTDIIQTEEPQDVSACVNVDEFVEPQELGGQNADHRNLVRDAIENAVTETWTPTHDAYRYALNNGLLTDNVTTPHKFMLLITDGSPTFSIDCTQPEGQEGGVDPEPIVDEVTFAASQGVRTFLIGSPGSEDNREWMSRAAVIGGSAPAGCSVDGPVGEYCHMDMTTADDFTQALRDGLARIAGVISACSYELPEAPNGQILNEDEVAVLMKKPDGTNILLYRDEDPECRDGWRYNDSDQIELCSETCDEVQLDNQTTVELVLGCDSSIQVPIK